jgi:signal transduction histidine kinase
LLYADSLQIGFEQMRALINLSMSYFTDNQFERAETSAQKTIKLARNLQSMDVEQRALNILAKVEARKNNFDKAYKYQDLSYRLRDTIMNENNKQHINYLEAEFQNEKKELKIDSLERQKNLYRIINIAVAFILVLFILILYLRQNAIRRKKQLAEQKIIQLEQEKQLVATQAVLDGETAERTRLARDLHDGLGGMLSAVKLNLFDMKQGAIIETEDVSRFEKLPQKSSSDTFNP